MAIRVCLAGDMFLTNNFRDAIFVDTEIKETFSSADISMVNLEAPVLERLDSSRLIQKDGPHLNMDKWVLHLAKSSGINSVCLANNHILDHGPEGLSSTIQLCESFGLNTVGAGIDVRAAAKPLIYDFRGKKIGIIAVCENEWSVAGFSTPGAHGLDLIEIYSNITQTRMLCDTVIVIFHGGHEHYHLPSPRIKKTMRFFVDLGADAVILHHAHRISGMEIYRKKPIFYGLGNFVFDEANRDNSWYIGAIAILDFGEQMQIEWSVRFVKAIRKNDRIELNILDELDDINHNFMLLSEIIANDELLNAEWNNFVIKSAGFYTQVLSPLNALPGKLLRGIARRLGFARHLLPRRHLIHLLNYVTCESHLDMSRAVLNKILRG